MLKLYYFENEIAWDCIFVLDIFLTRKDNQYIKNEHDGGRIMWI